MHVHWLFAHVYISSLILAGLLLLGGVAIVTNRAPVAGSNTETTWGGAGGVAFLNAIGARAGSGNTRVQTQQLLEQQAQNHNPITITPIDPTAPIETVGIEWEALLAQLVRPPGASTTPEGSGETGAYSFIPSGLISSIGQTKKRTAVQEALYQYGNTVGSYIQGFDALHANMLQVLKDAYEDRGNAEKVAFAIQIGADYVRLGKDIESIDDVPKTVQAAHMALAKAYQTSGDAMIAKLKTTNDDDFLTAVHTYNQSVEDFTKRYIALVTLFEVAEVQFGQDDPGKVFMFSASPSL